ncbi:MAG: carbon starvation protein A [Anaerolineaceae bacterium]|nr:carbon starvation protein A [Anaerolineaceae bacterium]
METILLMVVLFVGYLVAYYTYGRFLARRIFKLRRVCTMPSEEFEDGIDYVPTSRGVVFGHHFTSIAGTGPIVGPAIAIIWGWVPAVIWVFVGSIFMGAVHDLGAMVVSLRNEGKSIAEVAARYINPRVQVLLFCIVFLELLIVIGLFGLVIAILFKLYPQAVFPVWCEIPIAIFLGWAIYKRRWNVVAMSILCVTAMYVTVVAGHWWAFDMAKFQVAHGLTWIPATGLWTIILLAYAFIASTLPVTTLLQPRDYINAWQLIIAMGLLVLAIVVSGLVADLKIVAPAFQAAPKGAPPIWPFLFVIIACGAISGFHSLVASGTSSKQLRSELDALPVGYGSMIMESVLAVLVIIAVSAGIGLFAKADGNILTGRAAWMHYYGEWIGAKGLGAKVGAFVEGSANMIKYVGIPREIALVIMGVFVASFAGTTLDTATRIQRYVICELAGRARVRILTNRWVATAVAVVTAGVLAFANGAGGAGAMKLWPMFGSLNQLLAALALLVVTVYLKKKGGPKFLFTALPCLFMLIMTLWAMVYKEGDYIAKENWVLVAVNALTILLAAWMVVEVLISLFVKGARSVEVEAE